LEAGEAVRRGIQKRNPTAEVKVFSVGDGGEGTADALISCCKAEVFKETVEDTHGCMIEASYGRLNIDGRSVAVFDMATASGISHASNHGFDIMSSSTFGVGQLIKLLINKGYHEIIVGLGGSGTNDGGIGALAALGAIFTDKSGHTIPHPCTASLVDVCSCNLDPALELMQDIKLTLLYDAAVPLTGPTGASIMFSRQKGASESMVPILENAMNSYANVCDNSIKKSISTTSGAGAAGGLGYGLSLIGGVLTHGAEHVLNLIGFDKAAELADVIFTGEGKTDAQTATGKLAMTVAKHSFNKPVICLCGAAEPTEALYSGGISAIISITDRPMELSESISRTTELLEKTAFELTGII